TVESVAKAGSIGIIGVYPPTVQTWPIGAAMNKNLTVKMGNCPFDRRESGWVKVALAPVA
ncbi:MAG: glutathione-dependent formaldehyde dehydrogenase, partial [Pseudonocardiales bacterium]|nr:glutathione-dependent formaldehyde dehydrogenase [Pseudonocardiales bacterium]